MHRDEIDSLQLGPYTAVVQNALRTLHDTPLLRFQGELRPPFLPVPSLDDALRIFMRSEDDGFDWTEIRDLEAAHNSEGSAFRDKPPWKPFKAAIHSLYGLIESYVEENVPAHFDEILEDVVYDLACCIESLIFRGAFDDFYTALWEAYMQGGWPCGRTGPVSERDDGSWDISRASILVYWEPPADARCP